MYRDSQHNASQCASFLHSVFSNLPEWHSSLMRFDVDYVEVIIPLAQSKMQIREKKIMVTRFLEVS